MTTPEAATGVTSGDGSSALANAVLSSPEQGKGYYYPATAAGTPLALVAFGVTFMLLSMGNAEWYSRAALGGIMVPAAISLGAIGLIIAGLWDFRGGAGFNATWEIAYGTLWVFVAVFLSSVGDSITSAAASIAGPGAAPDAVAAATGAAANGILDAFGLYLLIWAAVTFGFTIGTWFIAKPAFLAFGLTAIAFVLLGFANISEPGSSTADNLTTYGGWLGIIASAIVLYLAFALILNDHLGRQVMPIFPYTG